MSSAVSSFAVRLLRRVIIGESEALSGTQLMVDAHTAHQLLREGAARLVDEADLARLVRLVPDGHRPRVLATR